MVAQSKSRYDFSTLRMATGQLRRLFIETGQYIVILCLTG